MTSNNNNANNEQNTNIMNIKQNDTITIKGLSYSIENIFELKQVQADLGIQFQAEVKGVTGAAYLFQIWTNGSLRLIGTKGNTIDGSIVFGHLFLADGSCNGFTKEMIQAHDIVFQG